MAAQLQKLAPLFALRQPRGSASSGITISSMTPASMNWAMTSTNSILIANITGVDMPRWPLAGLQACVLEEKWREGMQALATGCGA